VTEIRTAVDLDEMVLKYRPVVSFRVKKALGGATPAGPRLSVTRTFGSLSIDAKFAVALEGVKDPMLARAVERMLLRVTKLTGLPPRGVAQRLFLMAGACNNEMDTRAALALQCFIGLRHRGDQTHHDDLHHQSDSHGSILLLVRHPFDPPPLKRRRDVRSRPGPESSAPARYSRKWTSLSHAKSGGRCFRTCAASREKSRQ
jgi:hypothetical protein